MIFIAISHNSLPFWFYTFSSIIILLHRVNYASESQISVSRADTFTKFQICISIFYAFPPTCSKLTETQLCSELLFSLINLVLFQCPSYVNNNITHQILITTKSNIPDCFFFFYSPPFSVTSLFLEFILIFSPFLLSSFLSSGYKIWSLNYCTKFHLSLFLIRSY